MKQASLRTAAAVGGMLVPALIYVALNHADPVAHPSWAIPTATDIARARHPHAARPARAGVVEGLSRPWRIIDDLGAIVVIALFRRAALAADAGRGRRCAAAVQG